MDRVPTKQSITAQLPRSVLSSILSQLLLRSISNLLKRDNDDPPLHMHELESGSESRFTESDVYCYGVLWPKKRTTGQIISHGHPNIGGSG